MSALLYAAILCMNTSSVIFEEFTFSERKCFTGAAANNQDILKTVNGLITLRHQADSSIQAYKNTDNLNNLGSQRGCHTRRFATLSKALVNSWSRYLGMLAALCAE